MITGKPLVLFFFLLLSRNAFAEMLWVNGDNVHLRSEPDTNSTIKCDYGSGFPLKVIEKKGKWVNVSDFEEDTGWIYASLLSSKPHVIVIANKNSDRNVNIRKGPRIEEEIVGVAHYGVVFQLLEQKNNWVRVRHESGLEGWVNRNFLWGL